MQNDRFSEDVEAILRQAGWSPTRRVDAARWLRTLSEEGGFPRPACAEAVLAEFGGLKFDEAGAGVECAREPFELNPLVAAGYEEEFRRVEDAVGDKDLFPLGEIGSRLAFLAIAQSGSVYYFMESVGLLGRSIDESLIRLIQGRRPLRVWDVDVTLPPEQ